MTTNTDKVTVIRVVCAWCGCVIGYKDGQGQTGDSHGICLDCLRKQEAEGEGKK